MQCYSWYESSLLWGTDPNNLSPSSLLSSYTARCAVSGLVCTRGICTLKMTDCVGPVIFLLYSRSYHWEFPSQLWCVINYGVLSIPSTCIYSLNCLSKVRFTIIIIIIIIITLVITFMQGVYNYIPETNHVSRVYSVADVLYLQFVLHVMLFRQWSVLHTLTLAFSIVFVSCPMRFFF